MIVSHASRVLSVSRSMSDGQCGHQQANQQKDPCGDHDRRAAVMGEEASQVHRQILSPAIGNPAYLLRCSQVHAHCVGSRQEALDQLDLALLSPFDGLGKRDGPCELAVALL